MQFDRQAIDEFLAVLAHELRNPLAVIKNGIELVGTDNATLMMISRQIEVLIRLVDDLTDISRIGKGKIILKRQLMDIRESVNLGVESVSRIMNIKQHNLKIAMQCNDYRVNGDLIRLGQVFFNILNNAAKYTDGGGEITLTLTEQDRCIISTIQDNGMGIGAEIQGSVFDMFYQSESSIARSLNGMGIGLALVRNIIEGHGGEITVYSEGTGTGTTFVIRVPIAESGTGNDRVEVAVPQSPVKKRRILVVDDVPDIARSFSMLLKKQGHEVYTAESGHEALVYVKSVKPEIVISDIEIPDMSGHEIARKVTQLDPQIILIAVTGYGNDDDRAKSKKAGFHYHLVKPIETKDLYSIINETLPRHN